MGEKMNKPLADILRPTTIDDVVGQTHLLADGKVLRKVIDKKIATNMIFYGPSGVGKTTVAKIIANNTHKELRYLNATIASVSDIKEMVQEAEKSENGILLYLDEIQYFNKKQQQILLSYIESGDIVLIAATTENPYFYVYPAILSRSIIFEFKELNVTDIAIAIRRAFDKIFNEKNVAIICEDELVNQIARAAHGDVRKALNFIDILVSISEEDNGQLVFTKDMVEMILANNGIRYDRDGDQHYDVISAYQKSMRGSDPDAALYYLGLLLEAGDLPSACRRLLVCANEDVGLAYPQIISIVKDAVDTALMVGLPEAALALANAVVLVATAPKSNSTHNAINDVLRDIRKGRVGEIPRHLQNKHCDGIDATVVGQNYKYPHDYKNHYVEQQYLPDVVAGNTYYVPGKNKYERQIAEYWQSIKKS